MGGVPGTFMPRFMGRLATFVPRFMDVAWWRPVCGHDDPLTDHRTLAAPTVQDLVAIDWPRS